MSSERHVPRTWRDAYRETEEFQAIFRRYRGNRHLDIAAAHIVGTVPSGLSLRGDLDAEVVADTARRDQIPWRSSCGRDDMTPSRKEPIDEGGEAPCFATLHDEFHFSVEGNALG